MNLLERVSNKLQESAAMDAAWQLLGILASPDFIKHKDKLHHAISDQDWKVIDKLYTDLYLELRKHEIGSQK